MTVLRHVLPVAFWLCVSACSSSVAGGESAPPPQKQPSAPAAAEAPPTVVLSPPGRDPVSVRVELARSEDQRRRGLMFRQRMEPDAGMLFLFDRSEQLTFWMRNTLIALDMIFIESSMRVLGVVENAEPQTDSSRSVPGASQYVLEVNAGFSRSHGIGPGTAVRFEGVAKDDHGH